jgi:glyoxylase-like metal-dependent hydrolase (beta-lactamase superfamily II)
MRLHAIETGNFMLDGGAMFGVVPKVLWEKVYPANEKNLCNLSLRCLLVDTGDHRILIDTGMGAKQDEKFTGHYNLNGEETLEDSLQKAGYRKSDITGVVLTHLHFDHCGGAVEWSADKTTYRPAFPNARYWVSQLQWDWAMQPNRREKPSFLAENILPLYQSGQLTLFEEGFAPAPGIELRLFHGHTAGLTVPIIHAPECALVYTTDLFPTMAHLPVSWVCGYDTRPLLSLEEREKFLKEALEKDYVLFFEHDVHVQCCRLQMTEKGIRGTGAGPLTSYLSN